MSINDDFWQNYYTDSTTRRNFTYEEMDRLKREILKRPGPALQPSILDQYESMGMTRKDAQQTRIEDLEFQVEELEHALQMARDETQREEKRKEFQRKELLEEKTAHHLLKEKYDAAVALISEMSKEAPEQISLEITAATKKAKKAKAEGGQSKVKAMLDRLIKEDLRREAPPASLSNYKWAMERDPWTDTSWVRGPSANYQYDGTSVMQIVADEMKKQGGNNTP